jgi:hypothetical protein
MRSSLVSQSASIAWVVTSVQSGSWSKYVCGHAGRALADTVNERLGAALGDLLSEVTKLNAEREYQMR